MALTKKTKALYRLMELFIERKEISSYDEAILAEFGCDKKTLEVILSLKSKSHTPAVESPLLITSTLLSRLQTKRYRV